MTARAGVALIVALPALVWSAPENADQDFFKHAAESGIAEVQAGDLAESKGNSQAVRDFGTLMVKDHTAANEKLKSIAAREKINLPDSASAAQVASQAELEILQGSAFDRAYIRNQLTAHEETVSLLKDEIAAGSDTQARDFARETLPTVEAHLRSLRDIAAQSRLETQAQQ